MMAQRTRCVGKDNAWTSDTDLWNTQDNHLEVRHASPKRLNVPFMW
jgi:hypothetical protein